MLSLICSKVPIFLKNASTINSLKITASLVSTRLNSTENNVSSICPAGTPLNLKIKVNQEEPVALDDKEYPEWLWTIMEEEKLNENMSVEEQLKIRKRSISHDRKKEIRDTIELLKNK
ncbi:hypothetical protein QEN19_003223 [Hanseniaspora menglaensis]